MRRIGYLSALGSAVVRGLITGVGVRESVSMTVSLEEFLARTGALGFSRQETAGMIVATHRRYGWMNLRQVEDHIWQAMTEGRLRPGGGPVPDPDGLTVEEFSRRFREALDTMPTMEDWSAAVASIQGLTTPDPRS